MGTALMTRALLTFLRFQERGTSKPNSFETRRDHQRVAALNEA